MRKLLIFMLLIGAMTLFAELNIVIGFDTDVVSDTSTEAFTSDYFNITNIGETAEYTIDIEMIDYPEGWFMTWCHEDLSDVGLFEGCHHHSQPWTFTLPAEATIAVDFQINNMGGNEGMITFEYVISGGDLTETIVLPFSFRTTNYVSNDNSVEIPNLTGLSNYPNPFNPETTISFSLNKGSQIRLEVFNILGQHVATLLNEYQSAGNHNVVWDGNDKNGNKLSSGIYLTKLISGSQFKMNKMILMK